METSVVEPSTSPLYPLIDEEEELLPGDEDLMPCKRRVVGDRLVAVNVGDCGFSLREIVTVIIRESPKSSPKAVGLEDMDIRPIEHVVDDMVGESGPILPGRDEGSSSGVTADAPPSASNEGKAVAEEDVGSDSDMDAEELRIIDEGLTQVEVRLEGGIENNYDGRAGEG